MYVESQKSIYLQNDTLILQQQIAEYKKALEVKNNQILNCENKTDIILLERDFIDTENKAILKANKKLNNRVALFKVTTIISSTAALISTIGILIR